MSELWLRGLLLLVLSACGKRDSMAAATNDTTVATSATPRTSSAPVVDRIDAAEIGVPVGKSKLHVAWSIPNGTAINDDAPFGVRWRSSDGLVAPPADIRGTGREVQGGFDVPIEVMSGAEGAQLAGDIDLVVCDALNHSICVPLKRKLELTFAVGKGAAQGRVTLPLPEARAR